VNRQSSSSDLAEVDAVVPPTAATVKRVQRYVASESHDGHRFNGGPLCDVCVADARELLGALGLLP
jgi:hypothetical protein